MGENMRDLLVVLAAVCGVAGLALATLEALGNNRRTARYLFKAPAFYVGVIFGTAIWFVSAVLCWVVMLEG